MERKLHAINADQFKFDDAAGTFEGYASIFGNVDLGNDLVEKGAYRDTLVNRKQEVAMFFNHVSRRDDMPSKIGRYTHLEEDDVGLKVRGQLIVGHPTADAVRASMKAGTISGLSIGYRIPQGGAEKKGNVRLLKRIDLFEVSVVENPMNPMATIDRASVKSAVDDMKTLADAEAFLRDVGGFSANAAKDFVSKMAKLRQTEIQREAGDSGTKVTVPASLLRDIQSLTLPKSFGAN